MPQHHRAAAVGLWIVGSLMLQTHPELDPAQCGLFRWRGRKCFYSSLALLNWFCFLLCLSATGADVCLKVLGLLRSQAPWDNRTHQLWHLDLPLWHPDPALVCAFRVEGRESSALLNCCFFSMFQYQWAGVGLQILGFLRSQAFRDDLTHRLRHCDPLIMASEPTPYHVRILLWFKLVRERGQSVPTAPQPF